jgi:hypothetical protein|tara:strand:+ start:3438 stop:3620 length:183 start_codon:yes stop_codon:yes gene_type:complete
MEKLIKYLQSFGFEACQSGKKIALLNVALGGNRPTKSNKRETIYLEATTLEVRQWLGFRN